VSSAKTYTITTELKNADKAARDADLLDKSIVKLGTDVVKTGTSTATASTQFTKLGQSQTALAVPMKAVNTELTAQSVALPKSVTATNNLNTATGTLKKNYDSVKGPQETYNKNLATMETNVTKVTKSEKDLTAPMKAVSTELASQTTALPKTVTATGNLSKSVDGMKKSYEGVKSSQDTYNKGLGAMEKTQTSMGGKLKSFGSNFGGLATNVATLGGTVVNTARQYADLSDAQIKVDKTTLKLSKANEAVKMTHDKLNEAVLKYGANSNEAKAAALNYNQALEQQKLATTMLGEAQEDQQRTFENFWMGIVPTVTSSVGTVMSSITSLTGGKGIGGIKTALQGLGSSSIVSSIGGVITGMAGIEKGAGAATAAVKILGATISVLAAPLVGFEFWREASIANDQLAKDLGVTKKSVIDLTKEGAAGYSRFSKSLVEDTQKTRDELNKQPLFGALSLLKEPIEAVINLIPGLSDALGGANTRLNDAALGGENAGKSLTELALGINLNTKNTDNLSKSQGNLVSTQQQLDTATKNLGEAQKNYDDMVGLGTEAQVAAAKAILDKAKADVGAAKAANDTAKAVGLSGKATVEATGNVGLGTKILNEFTNIMGLTKPAADDFSAGVTGIVDPLKKFGAELKIVDPATGKYDQTLSTINPRLAETKAVHDALIPSMKGVSLESEEGLAIWQKFDPTLSLVAGGYAEIMGKEIEEREHMKYLQSQTSERTAKYLADQKAMQAQHKITQDAIIKEEEAYTKTQEDANILLAKRADEAAQFEEQQRLVNQVFAQYVHIGELDVDVSNELAGIADEKVNGYKKEETALIAILAKQGIYIPNLEEIVKNEKDDTKVLQELIDLHDREAETYNILQQQTSEQTAEYVALARSVGKYMDVGNANMDQLKDYSKVASDTRDTLESQNTTLFKQAVALGMNASKYKALAEVTGKTDAEIKTNNATLKDHILLLTKDTTWLTNATKQHDAYMDAQIEGTQAANDWVASLIKARDAGVAEETQIRKLALSFTDAHTAQTSNIDDLKDLISFSIDAKDSFIKLGEAIKTNLGQQFEIIDKDTWKEAKKSIKDFLKELDFGKGTEKKIKLRLEADFKAKEAIDKAQQDLRGLSILVRTDIDEEGFDKAIETTLGHLRDALAKGADVQPLIDLLEEIKSSGGSADDFVGQMERLTNLTAQDILTNPQKLIDAFKNSDPEILKQIAEHYKTAGDNAGAATQPLSEFQVQQQQIVDLNKVMNSHYIEGLNAMGNKTEEFKTFAGTRLKSFADAGIKNMQDMNKAMNTHYIAGLNASGNKTEQFKSVSTKAIEGTKSTVTKAMQDMNKVINTHFIAGLNAGGNKTAEFQKAVTSNMNSAKSAIDKVGSAVDTLKGKLDKLNGTKSVVTVEHRTVNTTVNQRHGGSHIYDPAGDYQMGGAFISYQDQYFKGAHISEYNKPELVTVTPLSNPNVLDDKEIHIKTENQGLNFERMTQRIVNALTNNSVFGHINANLFVSGQQVYNAMRPFQLRRLTTQL
jgi:hypothetical protein